MIWTDVVVNGRPVVVTVPFRPHLRDHHLRILGLVKLCHLEVLQSQRRRHDTPRVLADRFPALQARGVPGGPATQAFLTAGYDRATIRAVASAAGVDAGLVMHYFGSKQELYRRVIDAAPVPEVSGTPAEATEQILAALASRLVNEPVASLALLRSMLTNPEAAGAASAGIARYQAQIAQAIPAGDADLRAAIISAITLGITVSRHLIKSDELATADPAQVIRLLRPCVLSLAARPDHSGPPD